MTFLFFILNMQVNSASCICLNIIYMLEKMRNLLLETYKSAVGATYTENLRNFSSMSAFVIIVLTAMIRHVTSTRTIERVRDSSTDSNNSRSKVWTLERRRKVRRSGESRFTLLQDSSGSICERSVQGAGDMIFTHGSAATASRP